MITITIQCACTCTVNYIIHDIPSICGIYHMLFVIVSTNVCKYLC